jgi:hypothetical protein
VPFGRAGESIAGLFSARYSRPVRSLAATACTRRARRWSARLWWPPAIFHAAPSSPPDIHRNPATLFFLPNANSVASRAFVLRHIPATYAYEAWTFGALELWMI